MTITSHIRLTTESAERITLQLTRTMPRKGGYVKVSRILASVVTSVVIYAEVLVLYRREPDNKFAYDFAVRHELKHNFKTEVTMAAKDWFHRFMFQSENMVIRKPGGSSRVRITSVQKEKVENLCQVLENNSNFIAQKGNKRKYGKIDNHITQVLLTIE